MQDSEKINVFWFRRDLRLDDNTALQQALESGMPVLPIFIFDTNITDDLACDDARISFIHETLAALNRKLERYGSSVYVAKGDPLPIWKDLQDKFEINEVFINRDYEPYAITRDAAVKRLLEGKGITLKSFKDQVIFEEKEIVKPDGQPYTMFTPYSRRWLQGYSQLQPGRQIDPGRQNFFKSSFRLPSLEMLGFKLSRIKIRPYDLSHIIDYHKYRDIPAADHTTHLGPHLRFGTVSIRRIVEKASVENHVFLGELIWREFFMQILFNFPHVVMENFRKKYDRVQWRNDEKEFLRWCYGETGYPIVDAGMRQLNLTGFMHNRVRMIAAGFLCKHLLTDWRYGEAYFAEKLNDYELSSNNGNWQWIAGTGFDSSQYFRIFNPVFQQKKFDSHNEYVSRWIEDFGKNTYPQPLVEHAYARDRAFNAYRNFT